MKTSIILLIPIIMCLSCGNYADIDIVYYEKTFTESQQISQNLQLPFCIVLYDSLQITPQKYLDKFHANEIVLNKGIFNFIDITAKKNKWYNKLLSPEMLPLSCIFDVSGELIDLIPGNSKESVLYTDKALRTHDPNPEFHYNKKYNTEKITMINQLNNIFKLKLKVDDKKNAIAEINSIIAELRYPYILFLKLQNQLQFNDSVGAIETAKELLLFDSAKDLFDYTDEFMYANQLIDPNYSVKTAPSIEVNPTSIELKDCKINRTLYLDINITNNGDKILKISDVQTSCSCVKRVKNGKFVIYPKKSATIELEFTPNVLGNIVREIYIASNSINAPITFVTINACVN